ncbi:hypothetical protein D3P09_18740 [Paenibacillus pinisoli]|uniref:Uncharacterized protein n=1 Tax=Paenibacillus pinisoli TaxID=1276110 RepID=A0A3A6PEN4_9BACL|nr:hypothetical protein D3P09_18740 [Paenibacillus pinisoli]
MERIYGSVVPAKMYGNDRVHVRLDNLYFESKRPAGACGALLVFVWVALSGSFYIIIVIGGLA